MPRFAVLLVALLLLVPAAPAEAQEAPGGSAAPKNVILLIPDGFGPASVTMMRDYVRATEGRFELAFDSLHVGSTRTASSDSRITDSAAAGTALATGHKTYNGAVAVDTAGRPVATILEAAERQSMATGLVVTSRITHATPAVFSAHVRDRGDENEIAKQQLTKGIDVLLGGGARHFLPADEGGAREDGRNLFAEAREAGYQVARSREAFDQADEGPLLGLFTPGHMAYEIDRDPAAEPSLRAMTTKALDLLHTDPDGFFLMVEGSRIDHAGHANDAAAHLHDNLAFEEAVVEALDFARHNEETLVLILSDHETGGLTVGRNRGGEGIYQWYPEVLSAVKQSHGAMIDSIRGGQSAAEVLRAQAGIDSLSSDERALLRKAASDEDGVSFDAAFSEIIGRRSLVGWTSTAHTAVDVSTYAYGPGRLRFLGSHENTRVADLLAQLLDADLEALTAQQRNQEE